MLLPTKSSTASILLRLGDALGKVRPFHLGPAYTEGRQHLKPVAVTGGRDDLCPSVHGHVEGSLTERRRRPPDDERLAGSDVEVAEQARPGRSVGLRDRRQIFPWEIRVDGGDVRYGGAGVLGVTAIDRPAQPAHQGGHFRPDGEFPARAGLDDANALDAADVCDLRPFSPSHVHLGVVDAERLDLDYRVAVFGFRFRDLPDNQLSGPPNAVLRIARMGRLPVAVGC